MQEHTRSQQVIAVGSGKGGVGKSTIAVNLAVSLAQEGAMVGLLDADIHGPNIPKMMGIQEVPKQTDDRRMLPLERYGVKIMSIGFLPGGNKPVIWRGPLIGKIIKQFLQQVAWGDLEYLIVDLPPGTGDAQITLCQSVALTGGIIVSTPQDVALEDALRGLEMFRTMEVPILGLVENMSYFLCPHCQERTDIFAHGGARQAAARYNVPFLGELPVEPAIRQGGDQGVPVVVATPEAPSSRVFRHMCEQVRASIAALPAGRPGSARMIDPL